MLSSPGILWTFSPARKIRHTANWFILLFALGALVGIRLVVVPMEERALIATFGDGYRDFIRRTPCMLPKVTGRSPSSI